MAEEKKEANAADAGNQPIEEPEKSQETDVKNAAEQGSEEKNVKKDASQKVKKPKTPEFIKNLNFFSEVRKDLPEIKPGDVLRVAYRVIEGGKERIQIFEGTVIAIKNSGITKTMTVRKTSFGIAVERIFPLNSKLVQGIEVKKHSRVRRAKLYYLRNLRGKAAKLRELR